MYSKNLINRCCSYSTTSYSIHLFQTETSLLLFIFPSFPDLIIIKAVYFHPK